MERSSYPVAWQWALRGAFAGAAGTLELLASERSREMPTSPVLWNGAALLALGLLLTAEVLRHRSVRWSQGLAGAGMGALFLLGLFLTITRPAPEAGYPLLLATAAYALLRLGLMTGLLVTLIGIADGGFLAGTDVGGPLLLCLLFFAFTGSTRPRWQIASLLGIGGVCAAAGLAGWFPPEMKLLPTVVAPWLLHFGSSRPWRWTALAAVLALLWFWPAEGEDPRTAETALALAAGLLLLAAPLVRQLAREPDSSAARSALQTLRAAAVVAVAWAVPLEIERRRPWLAVLLAIPLLVWVGRRLQARWLWVPAVMAVLAALGIFAEGL